MRRVGALVMLCVVAVPGQGGAANNANSPELSQTGPGSSPQFAEATPSPATPAGPELPQIVLNPPRGPVQAAARPARSLVKLVKKHARPRHGAASHTPPASIPPWVPPLILAPVLSPVSKRQAETVPALAPAPASAATPPRRAAAQPEPDTATLSGVPAVIGAVLQQPLLPPEPVSSQPVVPEAVPGVQLQLQAGADLGVAAYRHDGQLILIFDQRIPIEATQVQAAREGGETPMVTPGLVQPGVVQPGLVQSGVVQSGVASTVLTLPWPDSQPATVERLSTGWLIAAGPGSATPRPLVPIPLDRRLELRVEQPGRVVTIIDPVDGRTLLAGTARGTTGGRAFVASTSRAPGYTVLPSVLGVVVEPLSDTTELRQSGRGFVLSALNEDLAPGELEAPPGLAVTRRFDFPALPSAALARRLQAGLAAAAAAPPRARTQPRLAAAQNLISLGFAVEAQALLTMTAADDPLALAEPDVVGLGAIAALLAGRVQEAQGLDLPALNLPALNGTALNGSALNGSALNGTALDGSALDGSAEIALWRNMRAAWRDGVITHDAALLPLALSYPAALQARVLPVLAEAAAAAEDDAALAVIQAARPDLPGVQLAGAMQLARSGPPGAALTLLDALAAGPDRSVSVRAAVTAAELRLHLREITPVQAAEIFERQSLAWRGDRQEMAWRLRAAALRVQAGAWRAALEGLRDTARLTPEGEAGNADTALARDRVADVFRAMIAPGAPPVPPLDFVALSSEFAAYLPAGETGQRLSAALADTLLALDLPLRAREVLKPLLAGTPPGVVRAGIGARMAQLSLDAGTGADAEAVLAASVAPDLPPALAEQRVLIEARARAARNDRAGALALLTTLGTAPADDLRAALLAQAGEWRAALDALTVLAAKRVPASGALPSDAQDIVLRQASAAVHCADAAMLARLRDTALPRMDERRGGLLRLLTASPITGSSDIARAGQELALGRDLPGRLQGLAAK